MGIINKILPTSLKPFSRDFGYITKSVVYKFKCIGKKIEKSPVFILGNQKSGTSVIASLLGELTNNKTSIDLFYSGFYYNLFLKWKERSINTKAFIDRNKFNFSNKIIKEPHLSVFYDELYEQFPDAKFVMIVRNPIDNIRSILDRLNINGNKDKLDLLDMNKIFHSWNLLFDNSWIGGNTSNYIEVLAERWNIIINNYLVNKDNMILIKYEDFINDKKGVIEKLAQDLNLPLVNDISGILDVQHQSKGKRREISPVDFFGQENIGRIKLICSENITKLGY